MQKLIVILCLLLPFGSFAQKKKASNGFIINMDGTKIAGYLSNNNPAMNSTQITFVNAESGEKKIYRPGDIKSWQVGEALYETKNYMLNKKEGYMAFMRRLSDGSGKVNLYEYWNTNEEHAFSQTFLEKGDKMTEVQFGRFRKFMAKYFEDCESLKEKIEKKEYKKKDILDIIAVYNAWSEAEWN